MGSIGKMILEGGIPAYLIVFAGLCALALIVERTKVLYFDYNISISKFMEEIKHFILNDKVDDAITYCTANLKTPIAQVVKNILERSDRDDEGVHQGLDIGLAEVIPNLGKRLGYLAMIANVATLLGLLGTISGLIMAFSAVSFADPSQKQIVLAQGISMAMNTTALGLSVAIPVMVFYAFLHSRQNSILEQVSEHSAKIVDLLTTRHYQPFSTSLAFPNSLGVDKLKKTKKMEPPEAKSV